MDIEIASIAQLTDLVQLAEPQNLLPRGPRHHANDSDARMDLDGDTDASKHLRNVHGSRLDVLSGVPEWGQENGIGTHTQMSGRWSWDENLASGDEAFLAGGIKSS